MSKINVSLFLTICLLAFVAIAQGRPRSKAWCIPEKEVAKGDLQRYLDTACQELGRGCEPIQPGKPCFEPPTLLAHAGYVMSAEYAKIGLCTYGLGVIVHRDPSHGACKYPSRLI